MLTHDGIEQSDLPYLRECIERGELINKVFALDLLTTLQDTFDELDRVRRVAIAGLEAARITGHHEACSRGTARFGWPCLCGASLHNEAIDAVIAEIKAGGDD
jgi:hypothetical protein